MTAPLVEELLPAPDPLEVCERCAGLPHLLFLDSAADPGRLGRFSFIAADPPLVLRGRGARTELVSPRDGSVRPLARHALLEARALLEPLRAPTVPQLPPFQGGLAGYIAYDWGAVLERLPRSRYDDVPIPDLVLGLYDWVVAWDHRERRAWIISTGIPETGPERRAARAAARLAGVRRLLTAPARPPAPAPAAPAAPGACAGEPGAAAPSYPVEGVEHAAAAGLRSTFTHRGYRDAVTKVREFIVAGDIFQANLSQRFEAPLAEEPWALYRRLRTLNPAPFAAYLAAEDFHIASASPERFLRIEASGAVEARPIKGTRPRGLHPAHDGALARALAESEKDRAENLMIVDLLRNDLSRVCAPGSVHVSELFAIEHYSTVHHLVSTITGQLEAGRDAVDLLTAAFPGGSITGAPKVRAMEIIAGLEPTRRGVYCGTIGYLGLDGAMDTSIVIRTCLALGRRVYFGAGGGIVADSDPEQEYAETLDKARSLIAAIAAGPRAPGGAAQ